MGKPVLRVSETADYDEGSEKEPVLISQGRTGSTRSCAGSVRGISAWIPSMIAAYPHQVTSVPSQEYIE